MLATTARRLMMRPRPSNIRALSIDCRQDAVNLCDVLRDLSMPPQTDNARQHRTPPRAAPSVVDRPKGHDAVNLCDVLHDLSTPPHNSDGFPFALPPFTAELREAAAHDFARNFSHPLVLSLADGTLSSSTFRFYQMQDAKYLEAFSDTASLISVRIVEPDAKLWWVEAARSALLSRRSLHLEYGAALDYGPREIAALPLTPTNRAYQAHMIDCATRGSVIEAMAAFAPCPWVYASLGQHIQRVHGEPPDDHPYAAWLRKYQHPGFHTYMASLLEQMQKAADAAGPVERARAKEAFKTSVNYEWQFWEQAWTGE